MSKQAHPAILYNPCSVASHNVIAPRYVTSLQHAFTGTLSTSNTYEFGVSGNSAYKPSNVVTVSPCGNFIGAGTGALYPNTTALGSLQPNGFGVLAYNLYGSYRVRASSIKVTATCATVPIRVTVVPVSTYAYLSSTDGQAAQSQPYSKTKLVLPNGTGRDATIYHKMDTPTIYGISETQMKADEKFAALVSTSPVQAWTWITYIDNCFNNSNCSVTCEVQVNYEVEFWDPLNIKDNT
jgi:hypothetical protein